ncbi:MAG: DUF1854 domain-containing protein [Firmicutes bacterium]|nr:DUF1854 domain-containing protein [Bacillota bacterium]
MSTEEKTAVSKVEETKDKKAETKAENKKEELKKTDKAAETAEEDDDEEEEVNPDELFKHRESINLTPENAWFSASVGGLISLKIKNAEGETEEFERVVIRRSFPVTAPNEFLSVREPDSRKKGRGSEIGMIRDLAIFDKDTVALINAELDLRYFTPEIKKITAAKEKFGYCYWEADTSAGHVSFVLNNPFSNIRKLEDGRIMIADMDGNCFLIPDPEALDRQSYKVIEIYI